MASDISGEGLLSTEAVVAVKPFTVRRIVKFYECDPAGVVYAGNFVNFASSASQLFLRHLVGGPMRAKKKELGVDLPAKAYNFVFHSSLWPDDPFDMVVSVVRIGRTSFTNQVIGTAATGKLVFVARLTPICVVPGGPNTRQAAPIPESLRAALSDHLNPTPHEMGDS